MRAVITSGHGPPSVLYYSPNMPRPRSPQTGELLIRVRATAVNRADTLQRKGFYPPPPGVTDTLGLELAGEVLEVGGSPSQCKFGVGDRVMALVPGGSYAELCLADAACTMPIPSGFSFTEAAAIPEAFLTAFQTLVIEGRLQRGDAVMIHAAASGVGTAALQVALHVGASHIILTCSSAKVPRLRAFADEVAAGAGVSPATVTILARDDDALKAADGTFAFASKVLEVTKGHGLDVVLDPVFGPGYTMQHAMCVALEARVVVIALMGGHTFGGPDTPSGSLGRFLTQRTTIRFSTLRSQPLSYKANLVERFLAFSDGKPLKPVIDEVLSIYDVAHAHLLMEANTTFGKLVLEVPV